MRREQGTPGAGATSPWGGSTVATARWVVRIATHPTTTATRLANDPSRLRHGLRAWLFMGGMYTVTVGVGYLNGFGAVMKPWLPIPSADYYLWETFFVIPVYFVVFATAAGTMQLVARLLGGTGSFEDTFVVVALGSILPTFVFMWLPETALMIAFPGARGQELGGFAHLPPWVDGARQAVVPIWTFAVYALALSRVQALSLVRALLTAVLGMAPAIVVTLVFVR